MFAPLNEALAIEDIRWELDSCKAYSSLLTDVLICSTISQIGYLILESRLALSQIIDSNVKVQATLWSGCEHSGFSTDLIVHVRSCIDSLLIGYLGIVGGCPFKVVILVLRHVTTLAPNPIMSQIPQVR
jgi:hypothetical protein